MFSSCCTCPIECPYGNHRRQIRKFMDPSEKDINCDDIDPLIGSTITQSKDSMSHSNDQQQIKIKINNYIDLEDEKYYHSDADSTVEHTIDDKMFYHYGYRKEYVISDTMHGTMFKAEILDTKQPKDKFVTIKKCAKACIKEKITKDIRHRNISFCSKSIIREEKILKYLASADCAIQNYIVK